MSSPAENPSSWQEVPMEILGLALHIINSLPDTARVAAVCRAWSRSVVHLHPPLPPQLPWLLLPDFKLCSLSPDGATAAGHRLPLPDGAVPICVGSISDGRVIMLKEHSCFLLNPLSGATSPLPDVDLDGPGKRIPSSVPIPMDGKPSLPRKVVMSCPPGSGSPCILAGISGLGLSCGFEPMLKNLTRPYHHTHHATLFLCRPGAAAWSVTTGPRLWSRSDIVFHKGKLHLFTTDPNPHLYAYDIGEDGDGTLKVTRLTPIFGPRLLGPGAVAPVDSAFFYLVESRGKLVLVQRDFMERRTHVVAVFALDESGIQPRWARMQSLDGEIIFLSANISVSVASSRYRGAGGDRIYFSQEIYMSVDGCSRGMDCPHQHCEVFDMRTRTAEALCMGTAPGREGWCSGPTWFVPSQQKHDNNAS